MKKIVSFILLVSLFTFNSASALSNEYLLKKAEKTMLNFNNSLDKLIEKSSNDKSIALINKLEKNINSMTWKLLIQCQKKYPEMNSSLYWYSDSLQNKSCYNFVLLNRISILLSQKKENINYEKLIIPNFENKIDSIILEWGKSNNINEMDKPDNIYSLEKIDTKNEWISNDSSCTLYNYSSFLWFQSKPYLITWKDLIKKRDWLWDWRPLLFEKTNNDPSLINNNLNYLVSIMNDMYFPLDIYSTPNIEDVKYKKLLENYNLRNNDDDYNNLQNYIYENSKNIENINREKIIQKYNLKIISKTRMKHRIPIFYELVKFKNFLWDTSYGVLECTNPMG